MSLNKRNITGKVLPLFLALAVSAGTVFAQEETSGSGLPDAAEDIVHSDSDIAQPDNDSVQSGDDTEEKQPRFIKVDEEFTYTCGEVFSLDAELIDEELLQDEEGALEEEELIQEEGALEEDEPVQEEGALEEEGPIQEEGALEEEEPIQEEGTLEEEFIQEEEARQEDAKEDEEPGKETAQEGTEDDVLQYESENPEIAVFEKNESGEVLVKAVGAGDTVIKITAPETDGYALAETEVLVHIKEAEIPAAEEKELQVHASLLAAPSLSKLENVSGGVSIAWTKIENAKGYKLERSTTGASPWTTIKTSKDVNDITYTDTQVTAGTAYYYRVRAYDANNADGYTGSSKKIIRILAPSITVNSASTGIQLRWNRPSGVGGYYVYRREASQGSWTNVAVLTQPGEIGWRDTSAANGKIYIYTVKAYKGSSFSAYAAEKSYVRVKAPTVKSWKRKSSTKFKLTWSKNTSATGYQIQYAQNGMFVGGKKVTVKGGSKNSYTVSKLEKKKNYYARIRAYITVNGVKYYSGWSAAKSVNTTRTAKATLLKKKKKVFEIRSWAKQKMYQYDTLQGSCTDGTYAYYLLNNRNAGKCKVVKVKRSTLKVAMVSGPLDVAHGNDMTYDSDKKRLVIVHSTGADPKALTSVNPQTLQTIESKHVQIPKKLAGGTAADAAGATAFTGLAYSSGRKQYAVLLSHNYNFVILDSDLVPIQYVKASKKNNYTVQGIDATDDYIMVAQSPKTSKQKYNIISVYDWDGNYISKINVKKGYEIESIYHVGSKYYAGFYRSYYKTTYKKAVRQVKVNGKIQKKTVKVKQRTLQRDNYVYQITGI